MEEHPVERNALRDKPGNVAIVKMDEKVRDRVNVLNNLKYQSVKKQKRLEELETQQGQMDKDASNAEATDSGESEEAQVGFKLCHLLEVTLVCLSFNHCHVD